MAYEIIVNKVKKDGIKKEILLSTNFGLFTSFKNGKEMDKVISHLFSLFEFLENVPYVADEGATEEYESVNKDLH